LAVVPIADVSLMRAEVRSPSAARSSGVGLIVGSCQFKQSAEIGAVLWFLLQGLDGLGGRGRRFVCLECVNVWDVR